MSLEEFHHWLEKFEAYIEWNKDVMDLHNLSAKTRWLFLSDCVDCGVENGQTGHGRDAADRGWWLHKTTGGVLSR
jgi:hypothetical protein